MADAGAVQVADVGAGEFDVFDGNAISLDHPDRVLLCGPAVRDHASAAAHAADGQRILSPYSHVVYVLARFYFSHVAVARLARRGGYGRELLLRTHAQNGGTAFGQQ